MHVLVYVVAIIASSTHMGRVVQHVLILQLLVDNIENEVGNLHGDTEVVVRDLRVLDVGPRPRQSGTQNMRSSASGPRCTPGYLWKKGSHCSIGKVSTSPTTLSNMSKGITFSKKQYPYLSTLEASVLRKKRGASYPITTGSPRPSQGRGHCKRMLTTVPEACARVVTPSTES